jgi:hypothetical protein
MNGATKSLSMMVNQCGEDACVLMSTCGLDQFQSATRVHFIVVLKSILYNTNQCVDDGHRKPHDSMVLHHSIASPRIAQSLGTSCKVHGSVRKLGNTSTKDTHTRTWRDARIQNSTA